ncbi:MAG TPA: ankyrin repeat domain-containing protein [Dermatophilaceae bacterium]|jgi:ankyrin repeat protein|nr:ankyrin repeat domain-containing protein [Dermatophilaceae bacterium]HOA58966.1 ankyrin repeat domain-containing protein [Dermatophilaceae bacterium]HPV78275.1 ankyrin repeat domain-containing protein [Dermatophilaceae bacterium]HPZ69548.1 ankyrin repeat domain-containing protein [Dermatophilaceae bacterium]HQD02346.1 ankyrin repeat domain-containing protein [Dermatophilaceae bacterium]
MSHSPHAVLATLLVALALTACGGGATATVPVQPPTSLAQTPTTPVPTPTTRSAELTTLNEGLRAAAWANDVTEARRLITLGADVNAKDETQQSAYLIATSEGYLDLLRLTLAHGAQVDDKDSWNGTGLIRAAERGHALVVGELLRAGINRDHINRIGYQAIHEAVWLGDDTPEYATTVRVLAAGGVELDRRSPSAELTPLEMARQIGHTGAAGILETITSAARPADPDAALLQAAEVGDANAVAIALRAGANIEARDAHDRTALLLAATYDQIPVANVLVAMGASPNALDDRHDTPWLVTGVTGSVAMLEALLPANPDLKIRNRFGGLSPIPASERGHIDYVRRVVLTGVDLNHVNDLGWTALLEAVILGDGGPNHQEVVQILLAAGADRDIADRAGVSALQHAEQRGQNEVARLLRQR